ncbi:metalloregulator ArsR/SmtB family transcription factor [Lujinxingia vulgaris]|uniref:Metalloregulator ArsR/SmtB family transcription factor n=1 Tax=Lujinxingia vulgaris TaxID=2600176 RepID=A0A5C6XIG7_9DELT|nr:metalloregulator ArsR/SmtB family transcription factor [Lujinxingia vulgaris]TXD39770.1 metalloregulator ArsR/SmtB family transcription factor [Lujinxingia vulgaris]
MASSSFRHFKDTAYAHLAQVGKALSSPARLEILELLAQAPRTVEVVAGEIHQSVANTSHHLQSLKRAELVRSQRDGLHVRYSLAGDDVAALLVRLQAVAQHHIAGLEKLTREFFDEPQDLESLDAATLRARMDAGEVVLIDVRPRVEFEEGHLAGALSIPLSELEAHLDELPRDREIVAYCRGPFCTFSAEAARRLRELGYDARRADISVHSLGESGARA